MCTKGDTGWTRAPSLICLILPIRTVYYLISWKTTFYSSSISPVKDEVLLLSLQGLNSWSKWQLHPLIFYLQTDVKFSVLINPSRHFHTLQYKDIVGASGNCDCVYVNLWLRKWVSETGCLPRQMCATFASGSSSLFSNLRACDLCFFLAPLCRPLLVVHSSTGQRENPCCICLLTRENKCFVFRRKI